MSEDLTKKLPPSDSEKLTLILSRLDKVEETLEERLYDTRPIWQKVVADIAHVQSDIAHLQEGQDALRAAQDTLGADVGEIKKSMCDVYYRFDVLNNTMLAIRADQRDIYDRVRTLESNSNPTNSQT
ncbi:MAG TPA: hypothetical protein VJ749_10230 [Pyrinomonadaceae bacterium]|nr:hypothetical protein [Pyrinomonadaceae bacterium]